MRITIIRTDGQQEHVTGRFDDIAKLIGATTLDTVNLRDGRVMLVDDMGYETRTEERDGVTHLVATKARKPFNDTATALYHAICRPGTTHRIVGDVAVIVDADVE